MFRVLGLVVLLGGGALFGCASAPKTTAERASIDADANQALASMTDKDPDLRGVLDRSAGYVVFPSVKQGGFVVGGAGGKGVFFEHGRPAGYAQLSQASVGAQVGGQAFSEVIVMRDRAAVDKMKASKFDLGGQASATMIKAGAASAAQFNDSGIAVFVEPRGGAMLNVSLTGQTVKVTM
jgi:lipid-binding SYLF domain-containing protein